MLFGRVKINHPHSSQKKKNHTNKKTPLYSDVRHDWNFKRNRFLWADGKKEKKNFLAAKVKKKGPHAHG